MAPPTNATLQLRSVSRDIGVTDGPFPGVLCPSLWGYLSASASRRPPGNASPAAALSVYAHLSDEAARASGAARCHTGVDT